MPKFFAIVAATMVFSSIGFADEDHSGHKGAEQGSHQGHGNRADAHFLDRFMKHHQDAVEMAKMGKTKAQSAGIKEVASKVAKEQPKEIAQMKTWRSRHFKAVEKARDMLPKMDMSKLKTTKGAQFDIAFAEMMAKHHEDGIKMIETVESELTNPEVKQFAEQSKKNQSTEREHLAQLRSSIEDSASAATSKQ